MQDVSDRRLGRILLGYLAGAWIAVEIAGFLTEHYGWSARVVDIAVLLAASGGLGTMTVGWYHGESGRQRVSRSEVIILSTIAVATLALAARIAFTDPYSRFLRRADHLMVIEFPLHEVNEMRFSWAPREALVDNEGTLIIDPDELNFELEDVEMVTRGRSVWLRFHESDRPRIYIDIPRAPTELGSGPLTVSLSRPWSTESLAFSARVARDALLTAYGDSTVVRIEAREDGA